jgi:hypothetical protein
MTTIRLIGRDHTSHHHGEVLEIAPEAIVRNNRNVVPEAHARDLVAQRRAEWVGEPPPAPSGKISPSEQDVDGADEDPDRGPWADGLGEFD